MEMSKSLFIVDTSKAGIVSAPVRERGSGLASQVLYQLIASSASVRETSQRLIRLCELCYGQRDIEALDAASRLLCNLPHQAAREFGFYYQAIVAHRRGDSAQAIAELNGLAHGSFLQSRTRQTLASIHYEQGAHSEALRLHGQILSSSDDCFAVAGTLIHLAVASSLQGRHNEALDSLRHAWPTVRQAAKLHPYLFYAYHNALAVELCRIGEIEKAARASRVALSAPISDRYPEWHETAAEIRQAEVKPILVVVPALNREGKPSARKPVRILSRFLPSFGKNSSIEFPSIVDRNLFAASIIISRVRTCAPIHGPPAFRK